MDLETGPPKDHLVEKVSVVWSNLVTTYGNPSACSPFNEVTQGEYSFKVLESSLTSLQEGNSFESVGIHCVFFIP